MEPPPGTRGPPGPKLGFGTNVANISTGFKSDRY
uniref:Uncharacterized protein n=1 Tax=Setaria italica TaxID=4555 RepID=K3Z1T0_SETIT